LAGRAANTENIWVFAQAMCVSWRFSVAFSVIRTESYLMLVSRNAH